MLEIQQISIRNFFGSQIDESIVVPYFVYRFSYKYQYNLQDSMIFRSVFIEIMQDIKYPWRLYNQNNSCYK